MPLALNCTPIVSWKTDLTPYEIMFDRSPHIMERPDKEKYDNLVDFLQERVKAAVTAQDLIWKQCDHIYETQLPKRHFWDPTQLEPGQWVLASRDLITTNTHSAKHKLMRAYMGPFQMPKQEGNHYTIVIHGSPSVYHRTRLKEITYTAKPEDEEGVET